MLDFESKIEALVDNYGLMLLLEQNDIAEQLVVRFLVLEGFINTDDYFNFDAEIEEWKRIEE